MSAGSIERQSTAFQRADSEQSNGSSTEFDLSSSPSTQNSGLLSIQSRERRAVLRSKRRSSRLSSSSSTKPLHVRACSTTKAFHGTALTVQTSSKSKHAQRQNDSMVYLQGPYVYSCGICRTHLTSRDDIVSKSFHGRHGRAYLFNSCVNVTQGPSEQRRLITGLHTVCDIFCKRCETLVGWTYLKAHESNQKYKEGKYIVEKINLHTEDSGFPSIVSPEELWSSNPHGHRSSSWDNSDDDHEVFEYEVSTS